MKHIRAKINLLPAGEGRHSPIYSGYRPPFYFGRYQTDGRIEQIDCEELKPGEESEARICLLHPEFLEDSLHIGAAFEFREGARVVGRGTVLEVGRGATVSIRHQR